MQIAAPLDPLSPRGPWEAGREFGPGYPPADSRAVALGLKRLSEIQCCRHTSEEEIGEAAIYAFKVTSLAIEADGAIFRKARFFFFVVGLGREVVFVEILKNNTAFLSKKQKS